MMMMMVLLSRVEDLQLLKQSNKGFSCVLAGTKNIVPLKANGEVEMATAKEKILQEWKINFKFCINFAKMGSKELISQLTILTDNYKNTK